MPFVIDDLLIGLAIAGASAAASGGINAAASANASGKQQESADRALGLQRDMWAQQQHNYEQQRADMDPWMSAGRSSLGELLRQMQAGDFETPYSQFDPSQLANDPGYQFRMSEGQRALERSASARGMLNSGAALKSLARYSQGVASDEYGNAWNRHQSEYATRQGAVNNRFNRLAALAGVGQTAAGQMGQYGAQLNQMGGQHASNMGNLYGALGNAQAAGSIGTGNAFSNMFGQLGGLGMAYGMNGGFGGGGGMDIPTQQPVSLVSGRPGGLR